MRAFFLGARLALAGFVVALAIAFGAALIELFPSAPALAGLGLLRTLARPLASLALELGLLAGVPAGLALAACALGRELRTSLSLLLVSALLGALVLLAAQKLDLKDESPGSVVDRLIAAARQSCSSERSEVPVPVVNVTLRCQDGRLTGASPFGRGTFSARELTPSADLSRLAFTDFELQTTAGKVAGKLRLRAKQATVRGFQPWGRGRSAPRGLRALAAWLALVLTTFATVALVGGGSRRRALFVGLLAGLSCALSALALDRAGAGAWVVALLPLGGVYGAALALIFWGLVEELLAHWGTLPIRRRRAIARGAGRW